MSAQRHRLQNPLTRRRAGPRGTGKTLLIVTEGEKTEPDYLKCLRNRLRLAAADIEIVNAAGTDALTIVNHAIDKRNERRREARKGCVVLYDSVWAVFDTERADTNPKLNDALQKAKANKREGALTNVGEGTRFPNPTNR